MCSIVTGSNGFLGKALRRHLENSFGFDLHNGNLNDYTPRRLADLWQGAKEIYHCAGLVGSVELENNVSEALQANVVNAIKVFEAAKILNARVFFPSKPLNANNIYTYTKKCVEDLIDWKFKDVRIIQLYNLFGPEQAIIPVKRMIPYFMFRALQNLPIQIYGTGEQKVDLLFVEDAAKIIIWYTRNSREGGKIGCGGYPATVREVAELINNIAKNTAGIEYLPARPNETSCVADPYIHEMSGIKLTPLEESLKTTFEHYQKLPETVTNMVKTFYNQNKSPN